MSTTPESQTFSTFIVLIINKLQNTEQQVEQYVEQYVEHYVEKELTIMSARQGGVMVTIQGFLSSQFMKSTRRDC